MLKRFASASVLVVLVFAMASGANAITFDKRTYFTFNHPVSLPGMTLPAGTYMFRIANPDTSRNVVEDANQQGTESYALLNTVQAYRSEPAKDSEIRFRETPAGAAPAVGTWWYMGETTGYEFLYSKAQLAALNTAPQPAPEVAESSVDVPPLENPDTSRDVVEGAGVPPVEESAEVEVEQESQIAQAQPPPPAPEVSQQPPAPSSSAREELPQTASPLGLLLLGGLATAGLGVKLLRKS